MFKVYLKILSVVVVAVTLIIMIATYRSDLPIFLGLGGLCAAFLLWGMAEIIERLDATQDNISELYSEIQRKYDAEKKECSKCGKQVEGTRTSCPFCGTHF